ncbi:MAG: hypothetical protein CM1200mP16_07320 [Nitrospina sp.]|nr:MAG: hypothetical protein CM1200mP16_07320 [Nitrospina sp.]
MITNPMWPAPATKWVNVRAATNGKEIAVRLSWTDPTRNDIMVQSQQYKDQAAIMFPVNQSGEEPPFTMGGDGERVKFGSGKLPGIKRVLVQLVMLACKTWKINISTWLWVPELLHV